MLQLRCRPETKPSLNLSRTLTLAQRTNSNGTKRLCRNIFAVQQTLSTVNRSRAVALDQALQFYELLNLQAEEVLEGIVANGASFAQAEYVEILNIINASAKVASSDHHTAMLRELDAVFNDLV